MVTRERREHLEREFDRAQPATHTLITAICKATLEGHFYEVPDLQIIMQTISAARAFVSAQENLNWLLHQARMKM